MELQDGALRLVLAATDMRQAAAAARLLRDDVDSGDANAARALETAIAVSYWRPWSQSNSLGSLKHKWLPDDEIGRELHNRFKTLRNETYAHTQKEGTRMASAHLKFSDDGELQGVETEEGWIPLPRDILPVIIEFCEGQATRFMGEATRLAISQPEVKAGSR